MKKFFLIAGLMVAAVVAVAFASCTTTNTTNQAADNATAVATPAATPVATPTYTPTPTPTETPPPTTTAAEVKNRVYTNEKFGYKITLPAGYTAEVASTGAPYDNNRVVIKDTTGEEFAVISTPMLEIGAEGYDPVPAKNIKVPGSTTKLEWWEAKPTDTDSAGGKDRRIILVWPADESTREADFSKSGMIYFKYLPNQTARLQSFETMINSLRFL